MSWKFSTQNPLQIGEADFETLSRWASGGITDVRVQWRARLILALAEGISVSQVCEALETTRPTISRWRKRFAKEGVQGLRRGKPRGKGGRAAKPDQIERAIRLKNTLPPPAPAIRWTISALARAVGCSASALRRAFKERGIKAPPGRPNGRSMPEWLRLSCWQNYGQW